MLKEKEQAAASAAQQQPDGFADNSQVGLQQHEQPTRDSLQQERAAGITEQVTQEQAAQAQLVTQELPQQEQQQQQVAASRSQGQDAGGTGSQVLEHQGAQASHQDGSMLAGDLSGQQQEQQVVQGQSITSQAALEGVGTSGASRGESQQAADAGAAQPRALAYQQVQGPVLRLPMVPSMDMQQQHQQQQQQERPVGPLLAFEKDPVPAQVPLSDWQHMDAPQELTSATFLEVSNPSYVAMCLVVRDQQEDIEEWVEHHLRLGVGKIYVWDNGSDPPLEQILQKYITEGIVVYTHFTEFQHATDRPQLYAYDRCLQDHGYKHHWMVFIDADEFLIFREGPPVQSLPQLLQAYEEYSGLGVHWILFGSSGHTSRPKRGVLRSYYKSLPLMHTQHQLIKTIANTRCTASAWGPHAFHHNCSQPVVRTNFEPVDGPRAERPVFDQLVIHHYATKSLEEFQMKMARGSGMRRKRGMEYFWFVDSWSVDYNFDAFRIWDDQAGTHQHPTATARYDSLPVHAWNER
ncbi:hypothetical protein N2152v2_003215 [Parachlorella kessleri]